MEWIENDTYFLFDLRMANILWQKLNMFHIYHKYATIGLISFTFEKKVDMISSDVVNIHVTLGLKYSSSVYLVQASDANKNAFNSPCRCN